MVVALLCGRKGSKGVPNKNIFPMLGKPLAWYPLQAALHSKCIDKIYISTDSEEIVKIGEKNNARIIVRPVELANDEALLEDVLQHGVNFISKDLGRTPDLVVILLCNAATVLTENIDKGIGMLKNNLQADSVATVALLNQYSPVRAKKIINGKLLPALDVKQFKKIINCDRRCLGDVYFCDASLWIIRPRCMDYSKGQPPFQWMGKEILPIVQQGGLDVDDEEGLYSTELWLRKHGFSETQTPY